MGLERGVARGGSLSALRLGCGIGMHACLVYTRCVCVCMLST